MSDQFLWLDAAQWQAIGTIALVGVTIWYAVQTRRHARYAETSADSAVKAAKAAERTAEISGQALRVTSTPVVAWSSLRGKVNDAGNPELDYRVTNTGLVAALDVSLAPIRYPVDGEPRQEPYRTVASVIGPGKTYPPEEIQEGSMVIPASGDNKVNWIHAMGSDSYGLVAMYRDFGGRRWRSEMGLAVNAPVRLELIEADSGGDNEGSGEEAE